MSVETFVGHDQTLRTLFVFPDRTVKVKVRPYLPILNIVIVLAPHSKIYHGPPTPYTGEYTKYRSAAPVAIATVGIANNTSHACMKMSFPESPCFGPPNRASRVDG